MIPELVVCLDRSLAFVRQQITDLTDEELVAQPPGIANHGAWTVCHLVFSFQEMAAELGVERWLPEDWESRFGYGSSPNPLASACSARSAVSAALEDAGPRLRGALLSSDETVLARPLPDVESRQTFPTTGHALLQVVAAHTAFHAGQLVAWRRAIGRPPVGVFI